MMFVIEKGNGQTGIHFKSTSIVKNVILLCMIMMFQDHLASHLVKFDFLLESMCVLLDN
jgi:hypothetical protein